MTFDLYFAARDGAAPPELADIQSWFESRPNFSLQGPNRTQAFYEHKDTDVYFWLDCGPDVDAVDGLPPNRPPILSFTLNQPRPSFFAMEAVNELAPLSEAFALDVIDPQSDQSDYMGFDGEGIFDSYDRSSSVILTLLSREVGYAAKPVPRETLHYLWRWNSMRGELQSTLGGGIFVPKIMLFDDHGEPKTGIVWTDGIPVIIPDCELICVYRDALAPQDGTHAKDGELSLAFIAHDELQHRWPAHFKSFADEFAVLMTTYRDTPSDLRSALVSLPAGENHDLQRADGVVDAQWLDTSEA